MNTEKWVDSRLAALNGSPALDETTEWQPDAARARARLRQLDRQAKIRRRFAWVAAAAASFALLALVQPRACATPRGCVQTFEENAAPPATPAPQTPSAGPVAKPAATPKPAPAARKAPAQRSYKEAGSPNAPIAAEIYSDYQCPDCTLFFKDIMPQLMVEYVQPGKVKILHRDFPLPQHQFAKLAARYANAAGQAGAYDIAVARIFSTQTIWRVSGDLDTQLASVLSPEIMAKVRGFVATDSKLDATMTADQTFGMNEGIHHTPSVVLVFQGKRELVEPIPTYAALKERIEELLQQK